MATPLSHRFSQRKTHHQQQHKQSLQKSAAHGRKAPPPILPSSSFHAPPKPHNAAPLSHAAMELHDQYDDLEEILRQFDMDMRYGPCLGLERLERWERAHRLGMQPAVHVKEIIERVSGAPTCVWEGRV